MHSHFYHSKDQTHVAGRVGDRTIARVNLIHPCWFAHSHGIRDPESDKEGAPGGPDARRVELRLCGSQYRRLRMAGTHCEPRRHRFAVQQIEPLAQQNLKVLIFDGRTCWVDAFCNELEDVANAPTFGRLDVGDASKVILHQSGRSASSVATRTLLSMQSTDSKGTLTASAAGYKPAGHSRS